MGGRGSSSATAASGGAAASANAKAETGKWGLPNDARAITVTVKIGGKTRTDTYYQNEHGMLMRANAPGTTHGNPVLSPGANIQSIYRNSVKNGLKFELHTQNQVDAANAAYWESSKSNYKDIAYAELHPQAGKAGYHTRRLLTSKKRSKGHRTKANESHRTGGFLLPWKGAPCR